MRYLSPPDGANLAAIEEFGGNFSEAMRVVLLAQTGETETIWLPRRMEGRYRPKNRDGKMPLIYIEPENGQWTAHVEKGAVFCGRGDLSSNAIPLRDEMVVQIQSGGKRYALYAEAIRPGDGIFLPYYLEERTDYTIGRNPDSHIHYENRTVSWDHARLHWDRDGWQIIDSGSTNGTYVNGQRVTSRHLENGDVIYIMGLYLLMGPGFVAVNNGAGRVQFHTPKIRRIEAETDIAFAPCPGARREEALFDRQPRKKMVLDAEAISFDSPPMPLTGNKVPMLLRMGSPIVMGGRALVTGNVLMALTSLVFPAMTQGLTEKDKKEYEEKRLTVYRAYLADKEREIAREKAKEESLLNEYYPALDTVLDFAVKKDRLWERRDVDEDFLDLRAGTGQRPLIAEVDFQKRSFEIERDALAEEMYALAERPVFLENVPVILSLRTDPIVGVLGFSKETVGALRELVLQLVLTHSCDEVKLVLLAGEDYAADFDFVRYLPHNWDDERSIRFFAVSRPDALQVGEYLSGKIEALLNPDPRDQRGGVREAYVVLALDKSLFDCLESLKKVLRQKEYCGVSVIAAFDGVPKECGQIIDLRGQPKLIRLASAGVDDRPFRLERFGEGKAQRAVRELMRMRPAASAHAYALPNALTFLEMFEAGQVEHLDPLRRWAENDPVKSLSVPIGVGVDGRPFTLDLHEKRQGPHGLVAGMTGSGKSEFIITYILSMAVNFSPDEVAFILIDYKGGGLADAFENKERGIHLPHLVGTITNLDGAAIDRSLASIKSELMRRQTVFKEVKARIGEGTLDIYDYQKLYRNKTVDEPLPHLFIISDEFAELKQQQPMFMDELISAARIGRSLGVHLILATQKPGGVVNNQIWSNTKFRACLRVQDRGDSMEMLKRPEAAELKQTGRFYLQVGYDEYFAMGQSAWCGADYIPQDEVLEEKDNAVHFLDNAGQTVLSVKPEVEKKKSQGRQVAAIVRYLSDLAKQQGIQPRSLWTEPLPDRLELETLLRDAPPPAPEGITALLGLVDDPEYQRQFPLYLDLLAFHNLLIVGNAGSGKSTLIRTMLYSLVHRYSPRDLNYYLVDFSDHALAGYSKTPHCGGYLTERESGDLSRLMDLINQIIAQRKALFAEANVSSFEAYREIHAIPLILFVVDGYTKIKSLEGGERFFMKFPDYLRAGTNVGVRFVAACNHLPEVGSQSKQEFDGRISLQAKDHYEHAEILNARCKTAPPEINGRGMCVQDGRALIYQAAMLDCELEEQERAQALQGRLDHIAERDREAGQAERLPMIDAEQTYEDFCGAFRPERIPLGYAARDMRPVAIPFQQLHSVSLYMGNPKGVRPIFQNLLAAARMNGMDAVVVRRGSDSVFDGEWDGSVRFLECTAEDLTALSKTIFSEFQARCVFRDEYCVQQGLPCGGGKGGAKKAAKYIRTRSRPMLVVFESFADFCAVEETKNQGDLQAYFMAFFSKMRGYNIYFAAGFYPGDSFASNHPLVPLYNQEEFLLLSGGRYDKAAGFSIPYEVKKIDKIDPTYNHLWMKYQEMFHPLIMPCGVLREEAADPDEAPVL